MGVVSGREFLQAAVDRNTDTIILDVRSDEEVAQGLIAGAVAIPADEIIDRMFELPYGKQIFIYCKSGIRAQMVYAILKEKGLDVSYLDQIVNVHQDGSFTIEDHTGGF